LGILSIIGNSVIPSLFLEFTRIRSNYDESCRILRSISQFYFLLCLYAAFTFPCKPANTGRRGQTFLCFFQQAVIFPAVCSAPAGLTNTPVQGTLNLSILKGFTGGQRLIFQPAVE